MKEEFKKYTQTLSIPCYQTDFRSMLSPGCFMEIAQDTCEPHSRLLGIGHDELIAYRVVWVLTRMHFRFHKPVYWRDRVSITTWHKGLEAAQYLRDFTMVNEAGECVVDATSSWVMINIDTREFVRRSPIECDDTVCKDNAIEKSCERLRAPRDIEPQYAYTHRIAFSDLDKNVHTNNAKYLLWSMNAIPEEVTMKQLVKDVKINFNHETRLNEMIALRRYHIDENVWMIEGLKEDGTCAFITRIEFE